jgi:hypothetical protein
MSHATIISHEILCGLWVFPWFQVINTVGVGIGVTMFLEYYERVNFWGYNLEDLGLQKHFVMAIWGCLVMAIVCLVFAIINCDWFQVIFPHTCTRCWGSHLGRAVWVILFFVTFCLSLALVGILIVMAVIVVITFWMKQVCQYIPAKQIGEVIDTLTSALEEYHIINNGIVNVTADEIKIECPKIGGNVEMQVAFGVGIIYVFQQFIFAMCSWNVHKAQVRIEAEDREARMLNGEEPRFGEAPWKKSSLVGKEESFSVELTETHQERGSSAHYQKMAD